MSVMKILSVSILAAILPLATAELSFNLQSTQRKLWGSGGLNGCWGQFHQEGSCVQKVVDSDDPTSDKVKFVPCDKDEPAQMWKFENEENFEYNGLLHNMAGGCLAVRGDIGEGKNLKVLECDETSSKQQWHSDGDSLQLEDYQTVYCVSPNAYPIGSSDPVVLLSCEDTYSLDY